MQIAVFVVVIFYQYLVFCYSVVLSAIDYVFKRQVLLLLQSKNIILIDTLII